LNSNGKKILVGVTGSVAAYKAAELVSTLRKEGFEVRVLMTHTAEKFVGRWTFFSLSGNPVVTEMFEEVKEFNPLHISLAEWADVMIIAPATANIIGKLAAGLADDVVCCTAMALTGPMIVAPAMNERMYRKKLLQANIEKLRELGVEVLEPEEGWLSCGASGKGRLPSVPELVKIVKEKAGV